MKAFLCLFVSMALSGMQLPARAQEPAKHRVVFQLSTSDTIDWKFSLNNIRNLKKAWGDSLEVEVVSFGPGIAFLVSATASQHPAIIALHSAGVRFVACENTLRERKIQRNQLVKEAETVPSGVGEIILRQEQGWSYVKGGR